MPPTPRGRFVWYDLMTTDPAAAIDFYRQVVGWTTQVWEQSSPPYTMFQHDATSIGGAMQLPEEARAQGAPPHWLCYIGTPTIHETVAEAKGMGATEYVPPTEIPTVGWFAVLADPQGATFATFQGEQPGGEWAPQVGDASWHELITSDWQAGFDFYQKLFGWQKTDAMEMAPGATYQMFGQNGATYGGMYSFMPGMPPVPYWMPYFCIADLDASVARVNDLGGRVRHGPMEVPGGDRVAVCTDAQGAAFGMHE